MENISLLGAMAALSMIGGAGLDYPPAPSYRRNTLVQEPRTKKRKFKGSKAAKKAARMHRK